VILRLRDEEVRRFGRAVGRCLALAMGYWNSSFFMFAHQVGDGDGVVA
jgi:hypothetical protein